MNEIDDNEGLLFVRNSGSLASQYDALARNTEDLPSPQYQDMRIFDSADIAMPVPRTSLGAACSRAPVLECLLCLGYLFRTRFYILITLP